MKKYSIAICASIATTAALWIITLVGDRDGADAPAERTAQRLGQIEKGVKRGEAQVDKVFKDVANGIEKTVKAVTGQDKKTEKAADKPADKPAAKKDSEG